MSAKAPPRSALELLEHRVHSLGHHVHPHRVAARAQTERVPAGHRRPHRQQLAEARRALEGGLGLGGMLGLLEPQLECGGAHRRRELQHRRARHPLLKHARRCAARFGDRLAAAPRRGDEGALDGRHRHLVRAAVEKERAGDANRQRHEANHHLGARAEHSGVEWLAAPLPYGKPSMVPAQSARPLATHATAARVIAEGCLERAAAISPRPRCVSA